MSEDLVAEIELADFPNIKIKHADLGWAAIALFVAAYDTWAILSKNETLSRAYWRAIKHPASRWPAILLTTGLYKHLVFPSFLPKLDPLYYVGEALHKVNKND